MLAEITAEITLILEANGSGDVFDGHPAGLQETGGMLKPDLA